MTAEQTSAYADSGNIADLVSAAANERPDAVALIEAGSESTLTWAQLDARVNAQVAALREAGMSAGDRIAIRLPTSIGFVVALFGTARAGGVAVPLPPNGPLAELHTLLEHAGATLLFGDGGEEPLAGTTVLDPIAEPADFSVTGTTGADSQAGGEDIAVISYTSGTTGPPRGVMLSHRALRANIAQVQSMETPPTKHGDRVLISIPVFHVYGLGPGLLLAAAESATVVLAERFDARQALADCARHRVTVIVGVPAMYGEFAALPAEELGSGLSTVRMLTSGAAPLHPKVLAAIRAATGLSVFEGYGLTETAPVLTSTLVTGYPKPGSVGKPLPGVELRLVESDGTGGPVPLDPDDLDDSFDEDAGGTGLVAVRGPNLFSGYWPDGRYGPDAIGWFRTGDVGYLDVDGDLHLVDRANDLIIVNGFNVYPHEVESVISELPEVAEAAVVGVLDDRSGESVKAVVVPEPGAALSELQIAEHCEGRLARYKVPRMIEFAEELPHSATGKLRRVRLRG